MKKSKGSHGQIRLRGRTIEIAGGAHRASGRGKGRAGCRHSRNLCGSQGAWLRYQDHSPGHPHAAARQGRSARTRSRPGPLSFRAGYAKLVTRFGKSRITEIKFGATFENRNGTGIQTVETLAGMNLRVPVSALLLAFSGAVLAAENPSTTEPKENPA